MRKRVRNTWSTGRVEGWTGTLQHSSTRRPTDAKRSEFPIADFRAILERYSSVATVGASADTEKPSGSVPRHLKAIGFRVIPVNPNGAEILGVRALGSLLDVDEAVDIVQVFRPSDEAPAIARQAVEVGAKVLWLQLGIASEEARRIAQDAGIDYVEDRCMAQETRRLGIRKNSTPTKTDRAS